MENGINYINSMHGTNKNIMFNKRTWKKSFKVEFIILSVTINKVFP